MENSCCPLLSATNLHPSETAGHRHRIAVAVCGLVSERVVSARVQAGSNWEDSMRASQPRNQRRKILLHIWLGWLESFVSKPLLILLHIRGKALDIPWSHLIWQCQVRLAFKGGKFQAGMCASNNEKIELGQTIPHANNKGKMLFQQ